jgi:hypothetical protein
MRSAIQDKICMMKFWSVAKAYQLALRAEEKLTSETTNLEKKEKPNS